MIGFIGLGNIGAPMARRLLDRPDELVVLDVAAAATAPFAAEGATVAATPAELAARARVISIVVRDEAQVADVLDGPDGLLAAATAGTVVAVHSTISAEGAVALAERASAAGVDLVDAPISGGAMGAHEGTLAVMVGGSDDAVERARPVLERYASLVVHCGPVGQGTRMKIARNLITFASFAAVGEAQRLAQAAGLDVAALGDVVRHSDRVTGGAGAIMLRPDASVMADDDGLRPIFAHTAALGTKDLELAAELGDGLNVDTPVAELARRLLAPALGLESYPEP
ncbi:MAG TPA: NAD(P)-dependent oxidoreductase [Microthrixaceae bacterium]|nr:NAD(P)-dependent oxidoreductase [Microthrixaceae bacterium]HMR96210.1 NAD(P)-dependent oxidoreductase [Microthrixaceae bacterium]HPG13995.1 NAD(P)-dependent oxidoreductase [Microthrixaceae bacterium]